MKQFLKILLMVIMLSILAACADNQESNQNNTETPSVSHTENENLEDNSQLTEYGDDTVDSTEDINRGETYWISGSTVNFRKTPSTKRPLKK